MAQKKDNFKVVHYSNGTKIKGKNRRLFFEIVNEKKADKNSDIVVRIFTKLLINKKDVVEIESYKQPRTKLNEEKGIFESVIVLKQDIMDALVESYIERKLYSKELEKIDEENKLKELDEKNDN